MCKITETHWHEPKKYSKKSTRHELQAWSYVRSWYTGQILYALRVGNIWATHEDHTHLLSISWLLQVYLYLYEMIFPSFFSLFEHWMTKSKIYNCPPYISGWLVYLTKWWTYSTINLLKTGYINRLKCLICLFWYI